MLRFGHAYRARDDFLAKATERAQTAEKPKKSLEDKARKIRSDFDLALQKKPNDIDDHNSASECGAKDGDTARRELKEARAEAGRNSKRITQLEAQAINLEKKIPELEA